MSNPEAAATSPSASVGEQIHFGEHGHANVTFQRSVLLPVDGSPHSRRALEWYMKELHKPDDLLILTHVIEPVYTTPAMGLSMTSAAPMIVDDLTQAMERDITKGKALLKEFMKVAKEAGIHCKGFIHVDNRPGPALVKSAEDHGASLIIIGNRGVGKLKRTFLGSVSDHVLHHSHVPVVVVPPLNPE